jgi:hypothetical protein
MKSFPGMGCMVSQPFAIGGSRSYPEFWGVTGAHGTRSTLPGRKVHRINMVKGHLHCSPTYCSKSCSLNSCRFSKSSICNDGDWKQAMQINKDIVYQTLPND